MTKELVIAISIIVFVFVLAGLAVWFAFSWKKILLKIKQDKPELCRVRFGVGSREIPCLGKKLSEVTDGQKYQYKYNGEVREGIVSSKEDCIYDWDGRRILYAYFGSGVLSSSPGRAKYEMGHDELLRANLGDEMVQHAKSFSTKSKFDWKLILIIGASILFIVVIGYLAINYMGFGANPVNTVPSPTPTPSEEEGVLQPLSMVVNYLRAVI